MRTGPDLAIAGLVQVAGIRSLAEARMVRACGVDFLGFPLRLSVHDPDTTEDDARSIMAAVGPQNCVLITYETDPYSLLAFCRFLGVDIVQLHADVPPETIRLIKARAALRIIKSYVVGRDSLSPKDFVRAYAVSCDAFITDTFDPVSGASGATGKTHDWTVSAELVRCSTRPVILAGGLDPDNVREAIRIVRPAAVDAHTGVEAPDGSKDETMVRSFVQEARVGFAHVLDHAQWGRPR